MTPESEYQKIREEIRAEHALIANRLTWYVTSQSFLVSAFAISSGSGFAWHPDSSAAFELKRARWIESQGMLFPAFVPLLFAAFWIVIHLAS